MNHQISKFMVCFILLTTSNFVLSEENEVRNYSLAGHGILRLSVPKSWQEQVKQPPNNLPPTIIFTPGSDTSFQILLTPLFSVRENMNMPSPADIKKNVSHAAEAAKSQAVEKNIIIKELKGTSSTGYYFTATDKAPNPGEYKYMTQGMLRSGDLLPTFTILYNDGAENVVVVALTMLKNAVHVQNNEQ